MGKMLGGEEEKDPDAAKKEEERQEALRQQEEERKAKYAKMEAERENVRQGIRDKVGVDFGLILLYFSVVSRGFPLKREDLCSKAFAGVKVFFTVSQIAEACTIPAYL